MSPRLVLCADGGGSKVCVVIRSQDGIEVRGTAGPCNVQSVGFPNAAQSILLATYRALSLLPTTHLPKGLIIPALPDHASPQKDNRRLSPPLSPASSGVSRAASPIPSSHLPSISVPIFSAAWLGLAGINTPLDAQAFSIYPPGILNIPSEKIKVSNDVNLLAAPALDSSDIDHVVTVVCGTGTVGRTLRLHHDTAQLKSKSLPLEDVAVSKGWGHLLCDEGSAFWIGRLAARNLISHAERQASSAIYSSPSPRLLPLHQELLTYFGVKDPMDIIELVSHTGRWIDGSTGDAGQVSSKRNAMLAGAARIVLRWAFPEDQATHPPSPPASSASSDVVCDSIDPALASQHEALGIAKRAIEPLIDLTLALLGDRTVVIPQRSALALGGGLMMSKGYRGLLLEGLRKEKVEWASVQIVDDAAGVGAVGLAAVEFAETA